MTAPIVTTIGRLSAQKGHDTLITAAGMVIARRPDARFLIAGDGDLLDALKTQAATLGIAEEVVFAGHRKRRARARTLPLVNVPSPLRPRPRSKRRL